MSAPRWAALLKTQAARYAEAGTAPALAALRCRALATVAAQLAGRDPEQVTTAELLATLEGLDLYRWHLHRLALADALAAGALLPTQRPPRALPARPAPERGAR